MHDEGKNMDDVEALAEKLRAKAVVIVHEDGESDRILFLANVNEEVDARVIEAINTAGVALREALADYTVYQPKLSDAEVAELEKALHQLPGKPDPFMSLGLKVGDEQASVTAYGIDDLSQRRLFAASAKIDEYLDQPFVSFIFGSVVGHMHESGVPAELLIDFIRAMGGVQVSMEEGGDDGA